MKRGQTNGVKNLRILEKEELFKMEPAINPSAIAALYSPDAGNAIPYEFAIALAENAVDNGVEIRIRREVIDITKDKGSEEFELTVKYWEPKHYIQSLKKYGHGERQENEMPNSVQIALHGLLLISTFCMIAMGAYISLDTKMEPAVRQQASVTTLVMIVSGFVSLSSFIQQIVGKNPGEAIARLPFDQIVGKCSPPIGSNGSKKITVEEMHVGGSGSSKAVSGVLVKEEKVKAKYVINCAGGASDRIARLIGDDSFTIKPRLGDYLLLNRNQVSRVLRSLELCTEFLQNHCSFAFHFIRSNIYTICK